MRHHRIRFLIGLRGIFYTKLSLNVGLVEAVAQLGLPVYLISHQWTFSFGYVKYEYIVPEINALKTRIEHATLTITGEKLANTWADIEYRLETLQATNGAYLEVY